MRTEPVPEDVPMRIRNARRGDRWIIFRAGARWWAGPSTTGVYVNLRRRQRWLPFRTWREAADYTFRRVYSK